MKRCIFCIWTIVFCGSVPAQTINWYVGDQIYQTTTCSAGDDVTPPSAPAKRGYTFTGWRDTSIIIGTWAQSGIPAPDNPVYPTFYQDGDLILRAVGSGNDFVADTYSASTGIITRRIGVKVLDGTEDWTVASTNVLQANVFPVSSVQPAVGGYCTALSYTDSSTLSGMPENSFRLGSQVYPRRLYVKSSAYATDATTWTNYLKAQYNAGTPVTVYYPLATPTLENYTPNANLE